MAITNLAGAAAAYANTAVRSRDPGIEARGTDGSEFMNLVKSAAQSTVDTLHQGEFTSAQALSGKADMSEVVTAVSSAEVTLQTAVAIRDRVVQAYLDIVRMPI